MGENIQNQGANNAQEVPVTENMEAKKQKPASLDDLLAQIKTESTEQDAVMEVQEKVNQEREKETEARWQEARRPIEEAVKEIKRNEAVYEGELYYGILKDKGDAYLQFKGQRAGLDIAEEEQGVQLAKKYQEVTGKSFDRDSTPEESIAIREKGIGEMKKKKEAGFTDEEKTNFRNYQWGVKSSLQGGAGQSIPAIHEGWMGWEGKARIESPSQLIDQMAKVREYRNSEKYNGEGKSAEENERVNEIHDDVYGYNRVAQGVAFGALEDGDIQTAVKALVFAEKIKPMGSDKLERVKNLLSKLEPSKRKSFVESFEAGKNA
jgi:hypothetical protein